MEGKEMILGCVQRWTNHKLTRQPVRHVKAPTEAKR